MMVTAGSGTWAESWVKTVTATDSQPVCPQVNTGVDSLKFSGQATDPANAFALALLTTTGNTYQLRVSTLSGHLTGTHSVAASGSLTAGGSGTNCVPPVASNSSVASESEFHAEELLLEGTIDAATPNLIKGQKTLKFGAMPVQYLVDWQFQK